MFNIIPMTYTAIVALAEHIFLIVASNFLMHMLTTKFLVRYMSTTT